MATFPQNISQYCWPSICQIRPNDSNIWTQHVTTLSAITCCVHLEALLRHVATLLGIEKQTSGHQAWLNDYSCTISCNIHRCCMKKLTIFKFAPSTPKTCYNMPQHVLTRWPWKCAQHAVTNKIWGDNYVMLKCWDHLARALALKIFE